MFSASVPAWWCTMCGTFAARCVSFFCVPSWDVSSVFPLMRDGFPELDGRLCFDSFALTTYH
jgi:hypothetical protein